MSSQYRVVVANNIEDFIAKKSRFINHCYQIDKGPFWGKTEILYDSALTFTRRTINCTILERGRAPSNLRGFTLHSTNNKFIRSGVSFSAGDISVSCSGDAFITFIRSGCVYHSLMVNDQFAKKLLSEREWTIYQQINAKNRSVIVRNSLEYTNIAALLDNTLDDLANGSLVDTQLKAIGHIQQKLLKNLVLMIDTAVVEKPRSNATHRLLYKASKVVLDTRIKAITVEDLASRVNTSRRNLEHVFQSTLGISPKQFILSVRMNRVRKDLLHKVNVSTAGIAKHYGISHLGHFSNAYKALFNELPSETRGRAAGLLQA